MGIGLGLIYAMCCVLATQVKDSYEPQTKTCARKKQKNRHG